MRKVMSSEDRDAGADLVGKYVICRCDRAGVHAGLLEAVAGEIVLLREARRLWSFQTPRGVALSGVAIHGIVVASSRLDTQIPLIRLSGVIEIIPCSLEAENSIRSAPDQVNNV